MYTTRFTSSLRVGAAATMSLLLVLAVGGCRDAATDETIQEIPRNVRVLDLTPETVTEYFEIAGPVAPVRGTNLSAEEAGAIVAITAAKGTEVAANQIILEQDRAILKAEMEAAQARLATQSYNIDKVRQLFDAGKVSRIELLTAEGDFAMAQSQATVTRRRYDRAGIKAPFAGVVVDRYVELGQLVAPGMPVCRVVDPYTLKLEAYLTDTQVQWVRKGDTAKIQLGESRALADGAISWVGFEADRATGKFKVEIEIPNPDLVYHSGVIGRARLPKNQVADVVAIPRDAVLNGRVGPTAYVVEGDRAKLRQLKLGASQGLMVVVDAGLVQGELLVVRGHRDLRDGSLVNITETTQNPDGSLAGDPGELTAAGAATRIHSVDGSAVDQNREAGQ